MTRRSLTAFVLAAAVALTGCATFTDNDVAARVGDVELTHAELAALVREGSGGSVEEPDRAPLEVVRGLLTRFVLAETLRADLDRLGSPLPERADTEVTTATLEQDFGLAFSAWQATPPPDFGTIRWRELYERGPVDSGIVCSAHILVESAADAERALAALDGGKSFADVAVERSTDSGSAVDGGVIPCAPINRFANDFVPEYVEAALDAEVGTPIGPVESRFGYHVIVLRPFDDLDQTELDPLLTDPAIRYGLTSPDFDVYIDPRYGAFAGARGIVPLG